MELKLNELFIKKNLTGSAYNMTVPKLTEAIANLKSRLKEKDVKNNPTLTDKIERYIRDFTTAKSEILKIVELAKQKAPNMLAGKANTLTLIQIYRKLGFEKDTLKKLEDKGQPWAYNIADFAKDTKGLAIGVACTSVALGVANAIATSVAGKGIMALIAQGIGSAFASAPLTSALIAGGLVIGAGLLIIPKIAKLVKKIKNNAAVSREIRNEFLENNNANDLDLSTHNADQIKEILKGDDTLRREIINGKFDFEGYSEKEKNTLIKAAYTAENELTSERRSDRIEIGKQIEINNQDNYLEEYEALGNQLMSNKDFNALKKEVEGYAAEALTPAEVAELEKEENKLKKLTEAETEAKTKKENLEKEVKELKEKKRALEEDLKNTSDILNDHKALYEKSDVYKAATKDATLKGYVDNYHDALKSKLKLQNELVNKNAELKTKTLELKDIQSKLKHANQIYRKAVASDNTKSTAESRKARAQALSEVTSLTSTESNLSNSIETINESIRNLSGKIKTQDEKITTNFNNIKNYKTTVKHKGGTTDKNLFTEKQITEFESKANNYVTFSVRRELTNNELNSIKIELGDETSGKIKAMNDATLDYNTKHNEVETFKASGPYKTLIEKRDNYTNGTADRAKKTETYNAENVRRERHKTLREKLLAIFGDDEAIKKAMAERHAAGLGE